MIRVIFSLVLLGMCLPAHALEIKNARFGAHDDYTRLVIEMDQSAEYRVFTLDNPTRLVMDFPEFQWSAPPIESQPKAGVKMLRHGQLQPGVSRVVFDLDYPVAVRKVFKLNNPARLVIDYDRSAKGGQTQRTYGTLVLEEGRFDESPILAENNSILPVPDTKPLYTVAEKPLIVIDPGHGGVDPGAIGSNNLYEKHITLKLAKDLKKELEATGKYDVLLTRDTDVFIKLYDRVKFARRHGADLFVSIHADSVERANVSGASVYTLSETASDAQTAKLAARENKADLIAGIDLTHEDKQVASILMDLAMRDTMNQSKYFAGRLVESFQDGQVKTLPSAHRHAGFAVLKAADIPSVLIEAGFMSNKQEAQRLNTQPYRQKVAKRIRAGIDDYFERVYQNAGL